MDAVPDWALSVVYWLHFVGTVAWIGGLMTVALIVSPAARRSLGKPEAYALLNRLYERIQAWGWFSLVLLAGTGLVQMSANPNYSGFLTIENRWAVAILAKHLAIGALVLVSGYQAWSLTPGLRRESLRLERGLEAPEMDRLQARRVWTDRLNLLLSAAILALTALARVS